MIKWLLRISVFSLTISIGAMIVIYLGFKASLPTLEGELETSHISANVSIERDAKGVATIYGENRADIAYATGYIHAQERFFQMDLSRRLAAGELSELFGSLALNSDKNNRLHRFRHRAINALGHLTPDEKIILDKYVLGVNEGLKALSSKPFEYWLLSKEPKLWSTEDTFLVVFAMFFDLQSSSGNYEWQNHLLRKSMSEELVAFLLPERTEWDAPMQADNDPYSSPEIPAAPRMDQVAADFSRDDRPMLGSNNWAVTGALTANGAAMVSNDMHLSIRAPSIWYKLRLKQNDGSLDMTGVTLPGTPAIVVGSNGSVAWGFTNTNIDTSDIIELTINPENENQYLTKDGYRDFENFDEKIALGDGTYESLTVQQTIWGPVIDKGDGNKYAYRWVAHMPDGVTMSLVGLEQVKTVEQAMSIADQMGIPAQNAMIVDKDGNAGWTIFGKIPRRPEGDYREVKNWSSGEHEWNSWYSSAEYPKIYNPESDRLWTANTRVVSGDDLAQVGTSTYDLGARAKQIRDRLSALKAPITENDFYNIMLDDEAIFLARWQNQLENVLIETGDSAFDAYLEQVKNWGGQADKNSVGFRLVRDYRNQVYETLFSHIVAACVSYSEDCNYDRATNQWEAPLWQLVTKKPDDWLPAGYESWQYFFEKAAFDAWQPVISGEITLQDYNWGHRNTTEIKHPLSAAVPYLGMLTDMPAFAQSGDTENMPHISGRVQGQSERIVVSPGYERDGIMNLPAGQSGHPLSPYYGAGHDDWLAGKISPFLPEETKWTLEFKPR